MATTSSVTKIHRYRQIRLQLLERQLLLFITDILLLLISCGLGFVHWAIWAGRPIEATLLAEQYGWITLLCLSWSGWLAVSSAYNLRTAASVVKITQRVLSGLGLLTISYVLLFFVLLPTPVTPVRPDWLPDMLLPRAAPLLALIYSTGLLLIWRVAYTMLLTHSSFRRRVLVLGAGNAGLLISNILRRDHREHYTLVGFIDDDPSKQGRQINSVSILGGRTRLREQCADLGIDEIVIAISQELDGELFQILMDCYEQGITITPMPLLYERLTGHIAVEHIGSQWYAALPLYDAPTTRIYAISKRAIDILASLIGLVGLLVVFPLVALAIKLDSPGPIFYKQQRAGKGGRSFWVYKFRSMVVDAEQAGRAQWAQAGDSRITTVGRTLRKMRIDELPQLLNILKGDMSIVGPRPERPEFTRALQKEIPLFRTRLAVKPGLTGWAQVNYGYGNTVEDALIKLKYDLYYIKYRSPLLDLLIVLRTLGVVVAMKGQ